MTSLAAISQSCLARLTAQKGPIPMLLSELLPFFFEKTMPDGEQKSFSCQNKYHENEEERIQKKA